MSLEIEGKLHKVFPIENKSGNFQAREFVVEVESGQYPQFAKFQLVQDRCGLIEDYSEGENIKVHFDLRGREWQGKYFTTLTAWRLDRTSKAEKSSTPDTTTKDDDLPLFPSEPSVQEEPITGADDLPF